MAAVTAKHGLTSFAEIARFRVNPSDYLRSQGEDDETFIYSLLKLLCKDTIQASIKIHILSIIHEYADNLISTRERAEDAVASLLDVFMQASANAPIVFKGQILVTTTSLVIQYDFQENCMDLFIQLVESLLDVVCHTNKPADDHLRSIACNCLQDLETNFPCMLQNKLEYFYQLAQMENGTSAQAYSLLLTTILRHTLVHLGQLAKEELPSNVLGEILTNRTEPLKPYILPKFIYDCCLLKTMNSEQTLQGIDSRELRRLVSFTIDQAHLFTVPSQILHMRQLVFIVKNTPEIIPSIFKWVIKRNSRSCDISYLGLLFLCQEQFGSTVVDQEEMACLFRSIVLGVNHPGLSVFHRLLLLSVLNSLTQVDEDSGWPRFLSTPQLSRLFPRVFDGCDLQLRKLELLSRLLPSCLPDEDVEELLCSCASLLHQGVVSGLGGRQATVLFRAFYLFYIHHPDRDSVESIKWMLIRFGESHGRLALRVLNFVEAAQEVHPNTEFDRAILLSMLSSITKVSQVFRNEKLLGNNLLVLQRIAEESGIDPQVIISYMHHLVGWNKMAAIGSWELGSQTLSVCRTILAHHNMNYIFEGLGHVLYTIMTSHPDVDIRDRAGFYYVTMSSITPKKLHSLLAQSNTSARDTQGLATMVNRSTELSSAKPITRLQFPLLKLSRRENQNPENLARCCSNTSKEVIPSEDILQAYLEGLALNENVRYIHLDFYLHFKSEDLCDIDELYALDLRMETSTAYADIGDVQVPILRRSESSSPGPECCKVTITLEPQDPGPTTITAEAVFTIRDGQTLLSPVEGDTVNLDDIWRPLPSPFERGVVFPHLWQSFTHNREDASVEDPLESLIYLGIDEVKLRNLIMGPWKDLQIDVGKALATVSNTYGPDTDELPLKGQKTGSTQVGMQHLGIFLPPKYHVLLELVPREKHVVVYMVTDRPQLLALVTDYLRKFESPDP